MRQLSTSLTCIVFAAAFYSGRSHVREWWKPEPAPAAETPAVDVASETAKLENQLIQKANKTRVQLFQTELSSAGPLRKALDEQGGFPESHNELVASLSRISSLAPHFYSLQARTAQATSLAELEQLLSACDALRKDDLDRVALKLYHHPKEQLWDAFLMVAQAAQTFSPQALNEGRASVLITKCPNCHTSVPIRSFKHQGPCNLICPHCKANYSMLVADNQGDYHYVNDFLIGFQPSALFPPSLNRIEEMRTIWQGVWNTTDYTRDDKGDETLRRDAWQTGPETLMRGGGDCDDLSILLADWLISRGFEARVALGEWDGEPHAWVVVLLDQITYILEATGEPPASAAEIATPGTIKDRYVPEMLFDRDACYYWRNPAQGFDNAYWSTQWQRLPQGEGEKNASVRPAQLAQTILPATVNPRAGIGSLQAVERDSEVWQIRWPSVK